MVPGATGLKIWAVHSRIIILFITRPAVSEHEIQNPLPTAINNGNCCQVTWRLSRTVIGRPRPRILKITARLQHYVEAVGKLRVPQQSADHAMFGGRELESLFQVPVVVAHCIQVHCTNTQQYSRVTKLSTCQVRKHITWLFRTQHNEHMHNFNTNFTHYKVRDAFQRLASQLE